MSTAGVAVLCGFVYGVLTFVICRRKVGRVHAPWVAVLAGACAYVGFRLGCGFHV